VTREYLYPAQLVMTPRPRRVVYDRWRDDQDTHIPVGCRVEQVSVHRTHGAACFRLGTRGVVVGRGQGNRLSVMFDGEQRPVSIRPYLVRVLAAETGTSLLLRADQVEHIVGQLCDLLPAPTGDDHG
jgi:hypothetical protein